MTTQRFIRLSLLFPYILWVVLAGFMLLMSIVFPASESLPILSGMITVSFVYTFGILVWGIPYTILALGLWIWSKAKPVRTMIKVFMISPLMMAVVVAISISFILSTQDGVSPDIGEAVLALGAFSIAYGYGIIGIVAGVYKLLRMGSFIQPENEIPPTQSD